VVRYRFSDFTLSPQRRLLARNGQVVALIPKYFDLLLLLIERRREAVHRQEIFDRVWGDVVVSESALSQAIRTIRRTLDDDPKEPRFIRTVSRHGYQFVFPVIEEEEDDVAPADAVHDGAPPAALAASRSGGMPAHELPSLRAFAGAALAGVVTAVIGGLILVAAPGSTAPFAIVPVLAVIAGVAGGLGGAGVGAGLAFAGRAARSYRMAALTLGGALGGALVGTAVQWLTRWGLSALFGVELAIGGGVEGLVIGGCAGLGFAIATRTEEDGGLQAASPSAWQSAVVTGLVCGMAGLALTLAGRPLAGGTIHALAQTADGSQATLAPLARLIGEPDFGPLSGAILAFVETAMFGLGLSAGLLRHRRAS